MGEQSGSGNRIDSYPYNSWFVTERDNTYGTKVLDKNTGNLVAAMRWVPDPLWNRYEIVDWRGIVVEVALDEPAAFAVLAKVANMYLRGEEPYAIRKRPSDSVEALQVGGSVVKRTAHHDEF